VLIDLEYDTADAADAFLAGLPHLWKRVDVIHDPPARVVELVEERALAVDAPPA
jgi:hypothetical protein